VGEGGAADEGGASAGALVGDFVDEEGEVAQLGEAFVAEDAAAHFELEIGDGGDEVAVAGAFAVAVTVPWIWSAPALDARQRVGDAEAAIVVGVMPSFAFFTLDKRWAVTLAMSEGSEPPLVSPEDEMRGARFVGAW